MKGDDIPMLGRMTGGAEPLHIERAVIVLMVGVGLFAFANGAGLSHKLASFYSGSNITTSFYLGGISQTPGLVLDRVVLHPCDRPSHQLRSVFQILK